MHEKPSLEKKGNQQRDNQSITVNLAGVFFPLPVRMPLEIIKTPSDEKVGMGKARVLNPKRVEELVKDMVARGQEGFGTEPLLVAITAREGQGSGREADSKKIMDCLKLLSQTYSDKLPR